jgi:hypothetical protein
MLPVCDRRGAVVAWLDSARIVDLGGAFRAFVQGGAVFAYSGAYLGTFDSGFFRDKQGHPVAFIEGATNGPVLPVAAHRPVAPLISVEPRRPVPPMRPIPPTPSLSWSGTSWAEYIESTVSRE